jgi:hypothetical protein
MIMFPSFRLCVRGRTKRFGRTQFPILTPKTAGSTIAPDIDVSEQSSRLPMTESPLPRRLEPDTDENGKRMLVRDIRHSHANR